MTTRNDTVTFGFKYWPKYPTFSFRTVGISSGYSRMSSWIHEERECWYCDAEPGGEGERMQNISNFSSNFQIYPLLSVLQFHNYDASWPVCLASFHMIIFSSDITYETNSDKILVNFIITSWGNWNFGTIKLDATRILNITKCDAL